MPVLKIGSLIILVVLLHAAGIIAFGVWRSEKERAECRKIRPEKGDIWTQDGEILFIIAVAQHGVQLAQPTSAGPHTWWDSWGDWETRCRDRLVLKTPHKRLA